MIARRAIAAWIVALAVAVAQPGHLLAQETAPAEPVQPVAPVIEPVAPYDGDFRRLATILGSLHYLRNLCGEQSNRLRDEMDTLLAADQAEGERRAQLIAAFNRGYRSFASVHSSCTDVSVAAISRYQAEGKALAESLVIRFKN